MNLKLFIFLSCVSFYSYSTQLIMFMGPSCAGKSTLSKYVCNEFNKRNEEWSVIDFDDVEENLELLIETANNHLKKNINVIIDTNTYEYEMEKKFADGTIITKIVVIAPLEILLERDQRRTIYLKRNAERAVRCRYFVISSFNESLKWPADLTIDSSKHSLQEANELVFSFLKKQ